MESHVVIIDDKFMHGLEAEIFNAIAFKQCPVSHMIQAGDEICFATTESHFAFSKTCKMVKILQQSQLEDIDPKDFGFATTELFINDLCNRFRYNTDNNNLYYLLYLKSSMNNNEKYNPEYDETPWRD